MSHERRKAMMNEFDKQFISAEYKAGYEKGCADALKEAAVCLISVLAGVALVVIFG